MAAGSLDALFVYGTLLPGHLRWSMLADHATGHRFGTARGQLYDTGCGWPAAIFDEPAQGPGVERLIRGRVVTFAPGGLAPLLPTLDEMEGIGPIPDGRTDPYVRTKVLVTTYSGGPGPDQSTQWAWAYHATSVGPDWQPIAVWDDQPEA